MSSKVSIIILNWNGWKDTIECLESLLAINYPNYGIIIVDNGSTDNSVQMIEKWANSKGFTHNANNNAFGFFEVVEEGVACVIDRNNPQYLMSQQPKQLVLIKNFKNYGFALGNNNAIRYVLKMFDPNYILLLNNDTVVDRAFLKILVDLMDNNCDIGIAGPINYSYSLPRTIIAIGERIDWTQGKVTTFTSVPKRLVQKAFLEVDEVPGSCFLFRSKMIDDIGLMDPDYFCYYEETDWCVRAKQHGWRICSSLTSKILHKYGSSEKKVYGFKMYYMTRNRFRFMRKWTSNLRFLIFLLLFLKDFTATTLDVLLLRKDIKLMRIYLTAIHDGLR